jgi:hypothetical protein
VNTIKRIYLARLIYESQNLINYIGTFRRVIDFIEKKNIVKDYHFLLSELKNKVDSLLINFRYNRLIELYGEVRDFFDKNQDFPYDDKYIELDKISSEIVVNLRLFCVKNEKKFENFNKLIDENNNGVIIFDDQDYETLNFCKLIQKTLLEKLDNIIDDK